jgi:hypothetical protein
MSIDGDSDSSFDADPYNSKLFANSQYPMFAFGDEQQEKSYDIGHYGVIAKQKDDGMILNNIITHLTSSFDPNASDEVDMGFGTNSRNN